MHSDLSSSPHIPAPIDRDRGFTLVEILIVIVVVGLLSVVVVFSVRGIVDRGEESSCDTDARVLVGAGEAYLAERIVDEIPPTGDPTDPNSYELTLVGAGLLKDVSTLHELDSDAKTTPSAVICGAPPATDP